ncbi:hypothetical protein [Streptomyces sp. KAU_LT]|uniref:hypothetical protein n=1 Tax=Streptomyces sp. KAU_LT TaxID=3046669 RepID=UPI0024B6E5DD|nr:hypothetical protein [Streptomyces sp. KAU_LT]MDI9832212.1 hypothetical protein [Streptomyces sp. KAU_LT]
MRRTPRTAAALLVLGAVLLSGTTACTSGDAAPRGEAQGVLPDDPDQVRSRHNAQELRAWVARHGDARQREAVGRVQRIIRAGEKGDAYVSTDINGGRTPVRDPLEAADAVAEAFAAWKDADRGRVSVYDVFGNAMIADREF